MRRLATSLALALLLLSSPVAVGAGDSHALVVHDYAQDGRPLVPCAIGRTQTMCLADTGTIPIIIPPSLAGPPAAWWGSVRLIGFGGQTNAQWVWLVLTVEKKTSIVAALVVPSYAGPPVLGMQILRQFKKIDFE